MASLVRSSTEGAYLEVDGIKDLVSVKPDRAESAADDLLSRGIKFRQVIPARIKSTNFFTKEKSEVMTMVPVGRFDEFIEKASKEGWNVEYPYGKTPDGLDLFSPDEFAAQVKKRKQAWEKLGYDTAKDPGLIYGEPPKAPNIFQRMMPGDDTAKHLEDVAKQAINLGANPASRIEAKLKGQEIVPQPLPGTGTPPTPAAAKVQEKLVEEDAKQAAARLQSIQQASALPNYATEKEAMNAILMPQLVPSAMSQGGASQRAVATLEQARRTDSQPERERLSSLARQLDPQAVERYIKTEDQVQALGDAASAVLALGGGSLSRGAIRTGKSMVPVVAASKLEDDTGIISGAAEAMLSDPTYSGKDANPAMARIDDLRFNAGQTIIRAAQGLTSMSFGDGRDKIDALAREREKIASEEIRDPETILGRGARAVMSTLPYVGGGLAAGMVGGPRGAQKFFFYDALGGIDDNMRQSGIEDPVTRLAIATPLAAAYAGVEQWQSALPVFKSLGGDVGGELVKRVAKKLPDKWYGRMSARMLGWGVRGGTETLEEPVQEFIDISAQELGKIAEERGKPLDERDLDRRTMKESFMESIAVIPDAAMASFFLTGVGGGLRRPFSGVRLPESDIPEAAIPEYVKMQQAEAEKRGETYQPNLKDQRGWMTMSEKEKAMADMRLEAKLQRDKAIAENRAMFEATRQEVERIKNDPSLTEEEKASLTIELADKINYYQSSAEEAGVAPEAADTLIAKVTKGNAEYGKPLSEDEQKLKAKIIKDLEDHGDQVLDDKGNEIVENGTPLWAMRRSPGELNAPDGDILKRAVIRLSMDPMNPATVNTVREEFAEWRLRRILTTEDQDGKVSTMILSNMRQYEAGLKRELERLRQVSGKSQKTMQDMVRINELLKSVQAQLSGATGLEMGNPAAFGALIEFVSARSVEMQAQRDVSDYNGRYLTSGFKNFMRQFVSWLRRSVHNAIRQARVFSGMIERGDIDRQFAQLLERTYVGAKQPQAKPPTPQQVNAQAKGPAQARPKPQTFKSFNDIPTPPQSAEATNDKQIVPATTGQAVQTPPLDATGEAPSSSPAITESAPRAAPDERPGPTFTRRETPAPVEVPDPNPDVAPRVDAGNINQRKVEVSDAVQQARAERWMPQIKKMAGDLYSKNVKLFDGIMEKDDVEEAMMTGLVRTIGLKFDSEQEADSYIRQAMYNQARNQSMRRRQKRKDETSANVPIGEDGDIELQDTLSQPGQDIDEEMADAVDGVPDVGVMEQQLLDATAKIVRDLASGYTGKPKQIMQRVAQQIESGMPLPSARELAQELGVTHPTVSKYLGMVREAIAGNPEIEPLRQEWVRKMRSRSVTRQITSASSSTSYLIDQIKNNPDGLTVSLRGYNVSGGYPVSPLKKTEMIISPSGLSHDALVRYLNDNDDIASLTGAHLGGWYDRAVGAYKLDISFVMENLDDAKRLAKWGNQDAIFDLWKFNEIRTRDDGFNAGPAPADILAFAQQRRRVPPTAERAGGGGNAAGNQVAGGRAESQGEPSGGGVLGRGDRGVGQDILTRESDPVRFRETLQRIASRQPHAASATIRDDYSRHQMFLADSGRAAFAITPDGEFVSVLKDPESSIKYWAQKAAEYARMMGATYLTAYDVGLPEMYAAGGFRAAARVKFDPQYAPENWNYALFSKFNAGNPDVVFMANVNGAGQHIPGGAPLVNEYDAGVESAKAMAKTTRSSTTRFSEIGHVTAAGVVEAVSIDGRSGDISHDAIFGARAKRSAHFYNYSGQIVWTNIATEDDQNAVINYYDRKAKYDKRVGDVTKKKALNLGDKADVGAIKKVKKSRSVDIRGMFNQQKGAASEQSYIDAESISRRSGTPATRPARGTRIEPERAKELNQHDKDLRARQSSGLVDWAKSKGLFIEPEAFDAAWNDYAKKNDMWLGGNLSAGAEHRVYYDEQLGVWFKSADVSMMHKDYAEYFRRLAWHKEIFPETAYTFVGITVGSDGLASPVVAQNHIVVSGTAENSDIQSLMVDKLGFKLVGTMATGHFIRDDGVRIEDLHEENIFRSGEGVAVIDPVIYAPQMPASVTRSVSRAVTPISDDPAYHKQMAYMETPDHRGEGASGVGAIAKALRPVSSVLGDIHPSLKIAIRRYEENRERWDQQWGKAMQPMLDQLKKLKGDKKKYAALKSALLSGHADSVRALMREYRLDETTYDQAQEAFKTMHGILKDLGLSMGYVNNYWPRLVNDHAGLRAHLLSEYGVEWNPVQKMLVDEARKKGLPLTAYEETELIAKMITRAGREKSGFPHSKKRVYDAIPGDLIKYYEDPIDSAVRYIENAAEIAARNMAFQNISGTFRGLVAKRKNLMADLERDPAEWRQELEDQADRNEQIADDLEQNELQAVDYLLWNAEQALSAWLGKRNPANAMSEPDMRKRKVKTTELTEQVEELKKAKRSVQGKINARRTQASNQRAKAAQVIDPQWQTQTGDEVNILGAQIASLDLSVGDPKDPTTSMVGFVVHDLLKDGSIKESDIPKIQEAMRARFEYTSLSNGLRAAKSLAYLGTLVHLKASVRNMADLTPLLVSQGIVRGVTRGFLPAALRNIPFVGRLMVGNKYITLQDVLGDLQLNDEYLETGLLNDALKLGFKVVGFNLTDRLAKEALMNAQVSRIKSLAQKAQAGSQSAQKELERRLREVFTLDEMKNPAIIQQLASRTKTDAQRTVAFNAISDYMPVTKSEMPVAYLRGNASKLPYMYRSYLIKFWDYAFNRTAKRVARGYRDGNATEVVKGLADMVRIPLYFTGMNVMATTIINAMLNRDDDDEDIWLQELWQMIGWSRYYNHLLLKENSIPLIVSNFTVPVMSPATTLANDLAGYIEKGDKWEGPRSTAMIPAISQFLYYGFPFRKQVMNAAGIASVGDLPGPSNLAMNQSLRDAGLPRLLGRGDIMERLYPPAFSDLMKDAKENNTTIQNQSRYGQVGKLNAAMKDRMDDPDAFYDMADRLRSMADRIREARGLN